VSCLFCQIAEKRISSKAVFESSDVYGFHDVHPQAPVHVLFIPKKHVPSIQGVSPQDGAILPALFDAANLSAKELGVYEKGYRLVINCKTDGGQTVDHLHLHLLGGRLMSWPPG
jgi:histidine triad (HIT) family protein